MRNICIRHHDEAESYTSKRGENEGRYQKITDGNQNARDYQ